MCVCVCVGGGGGRQNNIPKILGGGGGSNEIWEYTVYRNQEGRMLCLGLLPEARRVCGIVDLWYYIVMSLGICPPEIF